MLFSSVQFLRHLPANCLVCLRTCYGSDGLCQYCKSSLPWLGSCCARCGLPFPEEQLRSEKCGKCLGKNFPIDSCQTLFTYNSPIRELVSAYKHGQRLDIGNSFAKLMTNRFPSPTSDLMLPVPIAPKRFRSRGFNQSWELTRQISKALDIPCSNNILRKCRDTLPQSSQPSSKDRLGNLRDAFTLDNVARLKNVNQITIIDDVITTMSTVNCLARLLKAHGIRRVHAWGIARTC